MGAPGPLTVVDAGRGAARDKAEAPPFGAFAPTRMQRLLIDLANTTFLGRGQARWFMSRQIERLRPGPLDVERFGLKLRLHHGGSEYSDKKMLLRPADYDRDEIDHLLRFAHGDFHFADIGAHAGLYSLIVKARCPSAKVAAFEPHPSYFDRLTFNVCSNGLADLFVVNAAAGAERGLGKLYLEVDALVGDGPYVEIDVVPLLDALRELGFSRLDGMKIDVESYEDRVLFPFFEAAPAAFRPRIIVIEHFHQSRWERDCFALCSSLGYRTLERKPLNTVLERAH